MRNLTVTEVTSVAGGHGHNNNHHNNNNHNNNHHNNHNDRVVNPPHDDTDGIAKLNIIQNGLSNGDSWATIGKNIGQYFAEKYSFVDHFGR